ncbi:hypothetical protein SF23_00530, partial [Streptomyces sp. MBRL 10]
MVEVVGTGGELPQRSFPAGLWTRTDRPIAPLAAVASVFSTRYDKQRTDTAVAAHQEPSSRS